MGFSAGSADKESARNAGDLGSRSLGWEDPLEKEKASHSSVLAWRIPWNPWGRKESDTTERLTSLHFLEATPLLFQFRMFLMLTFVFRGLYAFFPLFK